MQLYQYRCNDVGPEHLNQPECGRFYTEKWLGEAPVCPNCGSDLSVTFVLKVSAATLEKVGEQP